MGMLDFLKKKKEEHLPMPPPPSPPPAPLLRGDLEPIRTAEPAPELPKMPELPEFPEIPEETAPELPELPPLPEVPKQEELPEIPNMLGVPKEEPPKPVVRDEEVKVFDKAVPQPVQTHKEGPVFVALDDYRKILNDTNLIRARLLNAEKYARRLSDIKNEEENAFEKWRSQLEGVEKKLTYVDQLIEKAQG